jgi:hypothetical protein
MEAHSSTHVHLIQNITQPRTDFRDNALEENMNNYTTISRIIFVSLALLSFGAETLTAQVQGIVNRYVRATSYNTSCNRVEVDSTNGFAVGDRVLFIQMQGATVNTSPNQLFGSITSYNSAGNFEIVTVSDVKPTSLVFQTLLSNSYDFTNGAVQIVRVARSENLVLGNVQAQPWNGATGGVVVVEAVNSLTLNGIIDVSGAGFRGGSASIGNFTCGQRQFFYPSTSKDGGFKGEGIATSVLSISKGRGAWANGGGGGNNHNAGGGGGGNAWSGGFGGYNFGKCSNPFDLSARGIGGFGLNYSSRSQRAYLGGGGGAGHQNDNNPTQGANGGGIVILVSPVINVISGGIVASGGNAQRIELDGAGGGGAGGTVLLYTDNIANQLTIDVQGGRGGDARNPHGPGGGGSAGVVQLSLDQIPSSLRILSNGGASGMNYELGSFAVGFTPSQYGSTNGEDGVTLTSVIKPTIGQEFTQLKVSAGRSTVLCGGNSTQLTASVIGTIGNSSIQWTPSTGLTNPTSLRTTAQPTTTTTYVLSVRDERGCTATDSVTISVAPAISIELGKDISICSGSATTLTAATNNGSGSYIFRWLPSGELADATTNQVSVKPLTTTTYYCSIVDAVTGCTATDSVKVSVIQPEVPVLSGDSVVCIGSKVRYTVTKKTDTKLLWAVSGASSMELADNGQSAIVTWGLRGLGRVSVSGDMSNGVCVSSAGMNIRIVDIPTTTISTSSKNMCEGETTTLSAGTGFASYKWSTGEVTPTIIVRKSGKYSVTIANSAGCGSTSDSIEITQSVLPLAEIKRSGTSTPCNGTSITLSASEGTSYLWSNGATTRSIEVKENATLTVKVTNQFGCSSTSTPYSVMFGSSLKPTISGNTKVCSKNTEVYVVKGNTSSKFLWVVTGAEDAVISGVNNDTMSVRWGNQTLGTITCTETTPDGCKGISQLSIEVNSVQQVVISTQSTELIEGESTLLSASEGFSNYQWSNGATTRTIIVDTEGDYSVIATNRNGCTTQSNIIRINVQRQPKPTVSHNGLTVCKGTNVQLSATNVKGSIRWSNGATTSVITVSDNGQYFFTVTNGNKTTVSDTVNVRVITPTIPTITRTEQSLGASQSFAYQWYFNGEAIDGATNQTYVPTSAGVYTVRTVSSEGCVVISAPYIWEINIRIKASVGNIQVMTGEKNTVVVRTETLESIQRPILPFLESINYSITISFDNSALDIATTLGSQSVSDGRRFVTLSGTTGLNGIITAFEVTGLFGSATETSIVIEHLEFSVKADIEVSNGVCTISPTCSKTKNNAITFGEGVSLKQNYPNPVHNSTTIEYTVVEHAQTSLRIADMTGSTVSILSDGIQQRGSYSVQFDATTLSSGSYFVILQTPSKTISREMIVSR